MRALDGLPRVALGGAVALFFVRVPADRGRVEKDGGALQRGQARAFRVPLVPADERADAAGAGVEGLEPHVAGREVELLIEGRVVGDVHLAVEADAVGPVEDDGAVVVEAGRALFEDGNHDRDAGLARDCGKFFRARPGDGLGEVEERGVFALAKVL